MKHTLVIVTAHLLAPLAALQAADKPAMAGKPNILLIFADDLGYHDLGCQGAVDLKTPQIDRLAASGARCTAGYVTAPQCAPSRAGLMTGMNQARFGYLDNEKHHGLPASSVVETLPEQLKHAGYTTAFIGKWHIGQASDKGTGWDYFPGNAPWDRGFDHSVLFSSGMSHYLPYSKLGKKWMTDRQLPYWLVEKSPEAPAIRPLKELPVDTYLTDYFSDRASTFIRENRARPWFLYLAYNTPHTPLSCPETDLNANSQIKDPLRRPLAAMMTGLDRGIGNIIATLEATGQRERTLVWFISDNGAPTRQNGSRNDPFLGHKGDTYEGGIRVPFIVSWPDRIPAGQTFMPMISTLDVLPTSLAAAGQDPVAAIHEGKNLLPWLAGQATGEAHDALFWRWRNRTAARVGNLKENRNSKPENDDKLPAHMFVDFAVNPNEIPTLPLLTNPDQQAQVRNALDAWLEKLKNDAIRMTPQTMDRKVVPNPRSTAPKKTPK